MEGQTWLKSCLHPLSLVPEFSVSLPKSGLSTKARKIQWKGFGGSSLSPWHVFPEFPLSPPPLPVLSVCE